MNTSRELTRRVLPPPAKRFLKGVIRKTRDLMPFHKLTFADAPATSAVSPYPFQVSHDNVLEQLGEKYQPTKRLHNYLPYYWMHFRDIRLQVKGMLEIGLETDRSIRMWEEFFPNATIYGMDINPDCKKFEGDRRRIFIGDQGDRSFLSRVADEVGPLDVIIDDGSHDSDHQLKGFELFFPRMSDHGIYVVEDTGGCVRDFGLRTVNSMKSIIDNVMYWPEGHEAQEWRTLSAFPEAASWGDKNVIGVAFYRWLVFAMRGKNPQDNPFLTTESKP